MRLYGLEPVSPCGMRHARNAVHTHRNIQLVILLLFRVTMTTKYMQ